MTDNDGEKQPNNKIQMNQTSKIHLLQNEAVNINSMREALIARRGHSHMQMASAK